MRHMESLRMQINDAEDQATKISVEEQTQTTIIHALEKDLNSAKSMTRQITDEADLMLKRTGDIRSQILDKQKMISSLESECTSITETLELLHQERISLSSELLEKRMYYSGLKEEMSSKLQKQSNTGSSGIFSGNAVTVDVVIYIAMDESDIKSATDPRSREAEERYNGEGCASNSEAVSKQNLVRELNTAQTELEKIRNAKRDLVSENNKIQQSIEQVKCQVNDIKLESKGMDMISLEDEHKALLSDKSGEKEYMQTLQLQMERLKGISHVTICACGHEYKVEVNPPA